MTERFNQGGVSPEFRKQTLEYLRSLVARQKQGEATLSKNTPRQPKPEGICIYPASVEIYPSLGYALPLSTRPPSFWGAPMIGQLEESLFSNEAIADRKQDIKNYSF